MKPWVEWVILIVIYASIMGTFIYFTITFNDDISSFIDIKHNHLQKTYNNS